MELDHCPYCQAECDRVRQAFGNEAPEPGDVSICLKCGVPCIFDDKLRLRRPTPEEQKEVYANEEVQAALEAWHAYAKAEKRMH